MAYIIMYVLFITYLVAYRNHFVKINTLYVFGEKHLSSLKQSTDVTVIDDIYALYDKSTLILEALCSACPDDMKSCPDVVMSRTDDMTSCPDDMTSRTDDMTSCHMYMTSCTDDMTSCHPYAT